MNSALVVHLLKTTKGCVVGVHGTRATVVSKKDEQSIFKNIVFLERVHDLTYSHVEVLDHGHKSVACFVSGDLLDIFFRSLGWRVHRVVSNIKKERFVFVSTDEVDCFFSDASGKVAFFFDRCEATINRMVHV